MSDCKRVYRFGTDAQGTCVTEGDKSMNFVLGGKGANLAEMSRIGEACGAQAATFMGLSGLGDLALTCTGDLSRNRQVGLRLGQGESLEHITSSLGMVAEGVKTTSAVYDLARRLGVETPVTDTVQGLLHGGESPREAVMRLMTRTLRQE